MGEPAPSQQLQNSPLRKSVELLNVILNSKIPLFKLKKKSIFPSDFPGWDTKISKQNEQLVALF